MLHILLFVAAFHVEEASIAQIQQAIRSHRITTVALVEQYVQRIKAYNGTCVREPNGILGVTSSEPFIILKAQNPDAAGCAPIE